MSNDERMPEPGTWDEWLLLRAMPAPREGESSAEITIADFVAEALRGKAWDVVDLGLAPMREGMRQLLEEFETATAGATVRPRVLGTPNERVNLSITATEEGKVRLLLSKDDGGLQLGSDYSLEQATVIAEMLLDAIRRAGGH